MASNPSAERTAALDLSERRALERLIAATEARFRSLVQHAPDVIAVVDVDGRLRFWSPSVEHVLGYGELTPVDVADYVHPDDRAAYDEALAHLRSTAGAQIRLDLRFRHQDGSWRWFEVVATNPVDQRGVEGIVLNARDVTDRRRVEDAARRGARRQAVLAAFGLHALGGATVPELYEEAAIALGDALGVPYVYAARYDGDDQLELHTARGWAPRLLGATVPIVAGLPGGIATPDGQARSVVLSANEADAFDPAFGDARACAEACVRGVHGAFGVLGAAIRDAEPFGAEDLHFLQAIANVLASAIDRVHAELELTRRSLHDPLSGLPNRALLLDRVSQALARRRRHGRRLGLLLVDVDRFKAVNDAHGHEVGDEALRIVARRLAAAMRGEDTVAHIGGDEFAVLTEHVADVHEAVEIARRLRRAVSQPVAIRDHELVLHGSVGIAVDGEDWREPLEVLRDADMALHWAKERGGDRYEIYDAEMRSLATRRQELESDLRRGLLAGELRAWFQPQVDLTTGRTVGSEALVRWEHPARGIVLPDEFLPVARETGLLVAIDELVLRQVARALAEGAGGLDAVSVNISTPLLTGGELPGLVADVLRATTLAPARLCLEVTEHMLLDDLDAGRSALDAIDALGVRIALDDFGTGYSSLQHLTQLPIGEVKIDRSFVQRIDGDDASRAVVAAVIAMARALAVRVVAEGVESTGQLDVLRELGCDAAQGFLWGGARPAASGAVVEPATPGAVTR